MNRETRIESTREKVNSVVGNVSVEVASLNRDAVMWPGQMDWSATVTVAVS